MLGVQLCATSLKLLQQGHSLPFLPTSESRALLLLFHSLMWSKVRTHTALAGPECLLSAAIPRGCVCAGCLSWPELEAHPAEDAIGPTGRTWDRDSSQLDGFLLSDQPAPASYTHPPGNFNVPGKSSQKQSHHLDQLNMWPTEQLPKSNPFAFERC